MNGGLSKSKKKTGTMDFGRNPSPLVDLNHQNVFFFITSLTSSYMCLIVILFTWSNVCVGPVIVSYGGNFFNISLIITIQLFTLFVKNIIHYS